MPLPVVLFKKGSIAKIKDYAQNSLLLKAAIYFISDENRLAVGTSTSTFSTIPVDSVISTVTSNTDLIAANSIILCNALSNAITLTLPNPVGCSTFSFVIKKIDTSTNAVTIYSSSLVDGFSTQVLNAQWDSVTVISNGTTFFLI